MPRQSYVGAYLHKSVQITTELGQGTPGEESAALGEVQKVPLQCTLWEGSWHTGRGSVQGSPWG